MSEPSLRSLFHVIKNVVPEQQEKRPIPPDMTVGSALEIMRAKGFSQLAVVEGETVLGVFSYRSFAQILAAAPSQLRVSDPLLLAVESFLERTEFAKVSDQIVTIFDHLDARDAVLVGADDHLLGMVTTIDALRYFYEVASPYYLIGEIERAIRGLIRSSLAPPRLRQCIEASLGKYYKEELNRPLPTVLEELTLNDYVMILTFHGTWTNFASAFGASYLMARAKIADLPRLRNDVFHFRRDLTSDEYEILRQARDWLQDRIRQLEARRKTEAPNV